MSGMKFKEIREKNEGELSQLELKLRKELADLWLKARAGQLGETAKIRSVKRNIARVLTARKTQNTQNAKVIGVKP